MRRNDIALIVLIVSVSLVGSYLLTKAVFGEPQAQATRVEVVEPISSELETPSNKIFNEQAINPTVDIEIGSSANQQPFGGN